MNFSYEINPIALEKTIKFPLTVGRNRFNKYDVTLEGYINSGGNVSPSPDTPWFCSGYIDAVPDEKIYIPVASGSAAAGVAAYNGTTLVSWTSLSNLQTNNEIYTVPQGANRIRVSGYISTPVATIDNFQISSGVERKYYEPFEKITDSNRLINLLNEKEKHIDLSLKGTALYHYEKIVDKQRYEIWSTEYSTQEVKAIFRDIIVRSNNATISITDTTAKKTYTIAINSTNFPNLISGSVGEFYYLMPWTRNLSNAQTATSWRLVVVTNKGQIYHNFPSRAIGSDGAAVEGDIATFDESVVWDRPERRYPSTNPGATGVEIYYPGLSSMVYEYYPKLNTDESFVDTYGNGGFGKSITHKVLPGELGDDVVFPRFYEPNRGKNILHSFATMCGYEYGDKLTLIGTYRGPKGSRMCVFATHDGGRSWYNKYEFAAQTEDLADGVFINTSSISGNYIDTSFVMNKRSLVIPSGEDKEPTTKFLLGSDVVVSAISKASQAVVTTATAHGLVTNDVVVFKKNTGSAETSTDWEWMTNETSSTSSGGNGMMFAVTVLTATTFKIREYVQSTENPLPCRHIHHINKVKDGWLIGTGEEYPKGWQLYIHAKNADEYSIIKAYTTLPTYRLNSSEDGVQRLLGAMLLDDTDNSFVVALDSSMVTRPNITAPSGRTFAVARNSMGIYKGKLSDIDDFTKYDCIYETPEPAYYFKEHFGAWMFLGQHGEFAISFDQGKTWQNEKLRNPGGSIYRGDTRDLVAIDENVIVLK